MVQDDNPENLLSAKRFGLSRKAYIFIICFLLSSFIWLLIKLSKEYSETEVFSVVYTNVPSDKVIVNNPDTTLTLHIKTRGFRILFDMLFARHHHININVGALVKKLKNSKTSYVILTSEQYQYIGNQIHYPNNVIAIEPDTLHFVIEKMYSKKVPVIANLNLSYEQPYEPSDTVRYLPDSVVASGPKVSIDTLKFVETVSRTVTNINSDQNLSLTFDERYKNAKLSFTPSHIKVNIPVEKFTEAQVDLTIAITNNPNNYIVRTFPEKTRVTYQVALSKYKEVSPVMFSAVADISKAIATKLKKIKVEIEKYPSFIKIRKIEPEKIEYILLK